MGIIYPAYKFNSIDSQMYIIEFVLYQYRNIHVHIVYIKFDFY